MSAKSTTHAPSESAEWLREKRVTSQFGIGRTPLKRLREENKIRCVSLREPGMKQGTLLYNVASIRAYIAAMEQFQTEGVASGAK